MNQSDQEIVAAHHAALAKRRAKYAADVEHNRARQRAWRHSPSGKASLAKKKIKDVERAKAKQAAYEAALQQVTAPATETPAPKPESLEALRQEVLNRFQQLLENYFRYLLTITEQI